MWFNDTASNSLDDDFDGVYDHWDMNDDNDGIWDYFELDGNDDLDDDSGTEPGNFFIGSNCVDQDDDGTDTDPDNDGWYQSVWDQGVLGQGLLFPIYDVDDNDEVPDGKDPDDDNNGVPVKVLKTSVSPVRNRASGITITMVCHQADDDWDADGIVNTLELNSTSSIHLSVGSR